MSVRPVLRLGMGVVLLVLFSAGCPGDRQETASTDGAELQRLLAQYEQWYLRRSPESAVYLLGDDSRASEMDDYSIGGIEADHDHLVSTAEALKTIDRRQLSEQDRLSFDLFVRYIQHQIDRYGFKEHLRPVNQRPDSIHLVLATLDTFSVFNTELDYKAYLSRLAQIPRIVDEIIERMRLGLSQGITYPKAAIHAVEGQLASFLVEEPSESTLFRPFARLPDSVDEESRRALIEEAGSVISGRVVPAFEKLHRFWVDEYYPRCAETIALSDLPRGAEWYQHLLESYTTTELTADQIHQLGLDEVDRIREEMTAVVADTGFAGSFSEFVQFLKTDPGFYHSTAEQLLTAYRARSKRIDPELPKIIGKLPRLPYGVRAITEAESEGQVGYCDLGSLAQGRASYLAMTTSNLKAIKKYQMDALILHEMVPGHHFQMSLAMEQENQPFFRKLDYDGYHAYVEGWALYSEGLGYEMGLYTDPYSRFGQLDLNMLRAIRLVVDTGIHALGWSREQAINFFKNNSSWDDDFVRTEVDRYIVYPGQAVSYKVGELELLRLRRLAEQELGSVFDLREFHDEVLAGGALPLSMLAESIERYIAEKKGQAPDSGSVR